jgi:GT2 family glycosyltransferase
MYNAQSWIGETLESVFHQTYPSSDIELLVVDDASRDDSCLIARKFLQDRPIKGRVISLARNGGVSAARNVGWREAAGDWVQFLDADDLLSSRKIELQAAFASQSAADVAVVYSPWQHFVLRDGQWGPSGAIADPWVDDDTIARILLDDNFGYLGPTLIRRSYLDVISGFDERLKLGEDSDLMLRLAMAGAHFRQVRAKEPAFFYRNTPQSLWRQSIGNVDSMRKLLRVWRQGHLFLRDRSPQTLDESVRRALAIKYSRDLDFLFEHDREAFHEALAWIRELGWTLPFMRSRPLRLLSRFVGYERALSIRLKYRRGRRDLRLHSWS